MKKISLIITLLFALVLCGCASNNDNTPETAQDKQKENVLPVEENIGEKTDVMFVLFENALKEKGILYEKNDKAASMIGAEEGYGYTTESETIEIYRFNPTSEAYINAVETNTVSLTDFDMTLDVVFNDEYCIISESQEIIDIFMNL